LQLVFLWYNISGNLGFFDKTFDSDVEIYNKLILFVSMKIEDVMSKSVVSVLPETALTEVAGLLFKNRFHGVPVLENGKLSGIITENDFFTKNSNIFLPSYIHFIEGNKIIGDLPRETREKIDKLLNFKAKDIMTIDCVSVRDDLDVDGLIDLFRAAKYKTLPVVDSEGCLVGIVTRSDILKLINA
jgi:CBS domain-containing protein